MTIQDLEQQLLQLEPIDRLRIIQSVIQSLIPHHTSASLSDTDKPLDLTCDRSPHHRLRSLPLTIPADFDKPMTGGTRSPEIRSQRSSHQTD